MGQAAFIPRRQADAAEGGRERRRVYREDRGSKEEDGKPGLGAGGGGGGGERGAWGDYDMVGFPE
jgi:hypothetical protein